MATRSSEKKTVLVTGSEGFIGKNLIAQLELSDAFIIKGLNRSNSSDVKELCRDVDFVFHLAGENRPNNPEEFKRVNVDFTMLLLKTLEDIGRPIPLLFTSSTQVGLDNEYGKTKKLAEDAIQVYGTATHSPTYIYRLPNVFGKWAKPNYNSVVATFCYNITHSLPLRIDNPDTTITLVHIDDVVSAFINHLSEKTSDSSSTPFRVSPTCDITIGELSQKIEEFWTSRTSKIVPDLSSKFSKALYGTLTSYYEMDQLSVKPEIFSDDRGWLFELIKSNTGGQIFVSSTNPGYTRGDHWHHTKVEKFTVIKGTGTLLFRHVNSDKITSFTLSDKEIEIFDVPVGYIHAIRNDSKEKMLLLIWASEMLDKEKPDTYYERVEK